MPSDKLDRLKAQRAAKRGIATRFTKEASDIITKEDFTRVTLIKSLISLIEQRIGTITMLDAQIVELTETAELEQEVVEASEVELRLKDTLDYVHEFTKKAETKTSSVVQ